MSAASTQTQESASAPREASCPLGSGDVLAGRYTVELLVGEGTYGWVLAALDVGLSPPRRVALKLLRPHYAAQAEVLRRFERRELEVLRRIEAHGPSAHVVRALEPSVLWHGALPYLVLEFIDGPSLREVLERGPQPALDVLALGRGLARGLASIHAVQAVHRDLKPTNVRLRAGHQPVIVDLGITRAFWETWDATAPGQAALTPRYASPEQLAGRDVGPSSDVYSLGLILCELLSGEPPSPGLGAREWLARQRATLPRALLEWVPRCLEREPGRRPSALELASALDEASRRTSSPGRWRARRWRALGSAALVLALGGAGGRALLQRAATPPGLDAPEARARQQRSPPWSQRWGDGVRQTLLGLALDATGHAFIAAQLRGTVDVGTGPHTSEGSNDVLVARFEPGGRALWSRRFGDSGLQNVTGLAVDARGHAFITGGFRDTLDFGGGPRLFNPGDTDVFLARLDPEGRTLWARRFGDVSEQVGERVAVDSRGHVVLTGFFHGRVDLGQGALVSEGLSDVFLARFTPEGQPLWSRRFGDAGEQRPMGLAVDGQGRIALTGVFEGRIDLGGGALGAGADSPGAFVALFDAEGRTRWSRRLEGEGVARGGPVAFDDSGHVLVAENLLQGGVQGFALSRFSPEGRLLWRRRFEGPGFQGVLGLASAPGGRMVVTGASEGTVDLEDGPLPGQGGADVFVLELGPDGALLGARRFGDDAWQWGRAVAVDAWGDVLVAGSFGGTLDLGSGPLVAADDSDFFLARLPPATPVPKAGTCVTPPAGLAAWYPLDEAHPGAAVGAAPQGRLRASASGTARPVAGALLLEGGYFEVPDDEALDMGEGPFSLSAWVRTSWTEGTQVLLDKRREPSDGGPVAGYSLHLERGLLGLQLANGVGSPGCLMARSASCTNYRSGRFIADGAWHLVTVTVERGTAFGGTFYVDGEAVSRFDPTVRTGSLDNGHPLRVGSRSSSETGLFEGLVDEVALWHRALSAEEVAGLYRAGRAGPCGPQSSSEASRRP